MTLAIPLQLLWGLGLFIGASALLLGVGLVLHGEVIERRHRRDKAGVDAAFATLMNPESNPLQHRTRRFQELLTLRMCMSIRSDDRDVLIDWCDQVGLINAALRWTASRRWATRTRGVRLLAALGEEPEVRLNSLADPHPQVRQQAAEYAPAQMGDDRLPALVKLFGDPDASVRFAAMDNVSRCGEAAVPYLALMLVRSQPSDVILATLRVALTIPSDRLASEVYLLTKSEEAEVRGAAIRLLPSIELASSLAPATLIEALDDSDASTRAAAAEGLGALKHTPALRKLMEGMRDSAWDVRRACGVALYDMGPAGQVVLRRVLQDEDHFAADMARLVIASSRVGDM